MRVLCGCAIGWMAGILVQRHLALAPAAWGVASAVAGLVLLVFRFRGVWGRRGLMTAALALGALAAAMQPASPEPPAGERIFAGEIVRPVEPLDEGRRVVVLLEGGARALVYDAAAVPLLPGDRVRFAAVARRPRGFWDEGAFDRELQFAARGLDWQIVARPPGIVPTDEPTAWSPWRAAAILRERAAVGLEAASIGQGGAVLEALILGRRGGVAPSVDDAFRRAGVAHVLSVSGLHLAAATALFFAFARSVWLRSPRLAARFAADRAAALFALPAAAAYTLVTGAEVATVRSLVCAAVVLGARALGRPVDALTALAAAALAILAAAPATLFDASFQLSFAAAAALSLVARRLPRRRVLALVLASAAATLATAPLTALHFDVIQPAGLVTNLVVVPLAELVVLPIGLVGAGLALISPVLAAPLVALAGLCAAALVWIVELLARVSPSLDVPPPTPVELAVTAAAVVVVLTAPWRRGLAAGATASVVCLAIEIWLGVAAPRLRHAVTVTFLDVGQGDAAVIDAPAGETWLVDSGGRLFGDGPVDPGEAATLRFLVARRVRRLDVVVVSHPHPDHVGGLPAVAARLPIGELWISGDDPGEPRWTAFLEELAGRGTRIVHVGPGSSRSAGAARLEVLAGAVDPARSLNDNSLVVRLTLAGRRVLFSGDVEVAGEQALLAQANPAADLGADVVKVPHHGSRTSSSSRFVAATHPALAVVSCGAGNHFGFPAPDVVAAWRAAGAAIARTDLQGAVTVTLSPSGELAWHTSRERR